MEGDRAGIWRYKWKGTILITLAFYMRKYSRSQRFAQSKSSIAIGASWLSWAQKYLHWDECHGGTLENANRHHLCMPNAMTVNPCADPVTWAGMREITAFDQDLAQ